MQKSNPAYKHGHAGRGAYSPEYHSWASMLTRCYNKKRDMYKYYGGKGITVCRRWHIFENFLADMGRRPKGKTLDRINGNRKYCKSNCRWATLSQQANNKSATLAAVRYQNVIVEIISILPTALPELYEMLQMHPEVIKKEVRALRAAGVIKTTRIKGTSQGRTFLCEMNGRS